jgi:hypothetical protein
LRRRAANFDTPFRFTISDRHPAPNKSRKCGAARWILPIFTTPTQPANLPPMKDAKTQAHHRAAQLWSILVFAARHQEIITYSTIERLTGLPRNGLGTYLDLISDYCKQKDYPELWALAVNESGFPGSEGMKPGKQIKNICQQRRVFAFNWFSHDCPHPENFK